MAIPRLQTTNQVFPAAASGTTVTPSGSAWTFGAYAQIVAGVGADLLLATVTVGPASAGAGVGESYEIEIAVGAAGSEVAICTLPGNVEIGTFGHHTLRLPYPIKIANGSRVAARIRRGTTSVSTSAVAITCVPQAFTGVLFPTTAAAKALPSGSAPTVTAGISWATGAIVQLAAAAASNIVVYGLATGPTGLGWTAEYEVDLLTGAAGSEVVVATIRDMTSVVNDPGWHLLPAPIAIAAGTRVSARARSSAGGTRDLFVNALYYDNPGADAPADTLATAPAIILPSAAAAISVSFPAGAGSATYGAWVEFTAATAQALTLFGAVPTTLITDAQIQVGVGAAGAEVPIATLQIGGDDSNKEQAYVALPIGVALIPSGARIAVRARAKAGAGSFNLSLLLMPTSGVGASAQATLAPQVLPDIIATSPASVGLQMVGSGSAWTNSAWVEYTTGLSHQIGVYGISQNAVSDHAVEIDLGVGPAGSEVPIYTFRFHVLVNGRHNVPALAPIVVAAGTRIALRVRSDSGLAVDADIQYYDSFLFNKVGSWAIGYKANANADRAIAISADSAGGTLAESGKVKIFGKLDVTDTIVAPNLSGINTGDVSLAGTPSYLTLLGQVLTRALINLASHVTGRLPFANLTAATAGAVLLGRGSGGAGDFQEISLGTGVAIAGSVLSSSGGGGGGGATISQGTYAALPGTCAVGDLYLFTDSVYPFAQCNTINVWSLFLDGKLATAPGPASGWTGVNTGANWTATDAAGSIEIQITRNAALNWRLLTKTVPATPYTITFYWRAQQRNANSSTSGVYFYDGTKLMGLELLTQSNVAIIRVEKITNVTTDNSTAASIDTIGNGSPTVNGLYARLSNNGTTLGFDWSLDGITWHSLFTEAVGTFITPTKYGFGGVEATATVGDTMTMSMRSARVQ